MTSPSLYLIRILLKFETVELPPPDVHAEIDRITTDLRTVSAGLTEPIAT